MNNIIALPLKSTPAVPSYEQLRDCLILPSKRKLRSITAGIDKEKVLKESFCKIQVPQQKNVFLLIDEVQIRPTVAFSGGEKWKKAKCCY